VANVLVLVVEDDDKLGRILERALVHEGYAVDRATNGTDALWAVTETDYDAVLLDVMIPAPDGFEVCRRLREQERWMPVLLLTARDAVSDRVTGLDAGADDYLQKPFALDELFARLRALLRRGRIERPAVLQAGALLLDPATCVASRGGVEVSLSARELALLEFLLRHRDEVVTRSQLLDHVWDPAYAGSSNVVDVYIRYLRDKVDRPFGRQTIETVRGIGYRLRSDDGR
jgi:two-component system, OmpR family, response regulator